MVIVFTILRKTVGLRVSAAEEIEGLDIAEHGLTNAYADFAYTVPNIGYADCTAAAVPLQDVQPLPLHLEGGTSGRRYTRVSILCSEERFPVLKETMAAIGVQGMTVTNVMGGGAHKGKTGQYRGLETPMHLLPKVQVDIVVSRIDPGLVVAAARKALYTGGVGDGKIFISDVEDVYRVRTGEQGYGALQYEGEPG